MGTEHEGNAKEPIAPAEAGAAATGGELPEIRAAARLVAALAAPAPKRKGYRPSFEALVRAPGSGPALFPIPGAAVRQTTKVKPAPKPARTPTPVPTATATSAAPAPAPRLIRRALPSALSAVAAACLTVMVMRHQEPRPAGPIAAGVALPATAAPTPPFPPPAPAVAPAASTEPAAPVAAAAEPSASTEPPLPAPAEDPAAAPAGKPVVASSKKRSVSEARKPTARAEIPHSPAAEPAPALVAAAPAAAPATGKKDERSLDQLLDAVAKPRPDDGDDPTLAKLQDPNLPPLTRNEIFAAMKILRPRIKDCYKQYRLRGLAQVRIEVGKAGEVTSAAVKNPPFAGTPTGECLESAVKTASFPASAGMAFRYPFAVR